MKEFWIHAQVYPKVILSSIMGKTIMITEDLIRRLIGSEDTDIVNASIGRVDMAKVYSEVFTSGLPSNKIRDMKTHYKIWAKIFMGCIHHRKLRTPQIILTHVNSILCTILGKTSRWIFHTSCLFICGIM